MKIYSYIEISKSLFWCKFHRIHILWASTICTNFPLLCYCLNLKCTASELLSFYRRHPSFWSFEALIFSSLITHSAWINKLIKQEKVLLFEIFAERMNQIHCHIITNFCLYWKYFNLECTKLLNNHVIDYHPHFRGSTQSTLKYLVHNQMCKIYDLALNSISSLSLTYDSS